MNPPLLSNLRVVTPISAMAVGRTPFVLPLSVLLVVALLPISSIQCAMEDADPANGIVIGIDLGTTYSCVGVYKDGRVDIIANDLGNRITPSYVAFSPDGERLIGDAAKNQLTSNPENTVFDVKRLIGRRWEEKSVQSDVGVLPYKVVNNNGRPTVQVDIAGSTHQFTPEEITAMLLTQMKETAEAYLGQNVTSAILTVPAYFNDAQRQATREAGAIAGLDILRIINEPTAAALAFGIDKLYPHEEVNVLVYNLGGGTFDVSILTIDTGIFEVLTASGESYLGGEDFDQRIINHLVEVIKMKTGYNVSKSSQAIQKLRQEAEKAKRMLSSQYVTNIEIRNIVGGVDVSEELTRTKFEELNKDLFLSTLEPIRTALRDSDLTKDDINEILLVGGSTHIPKIQQLVKDFFDGKELFNGKEPNPGISPDEAVAHGAVLYHTDNNLNDIVLCDINPITISLGIETVGGVMSTLIQRNTFIPARKSQIFSTIVDNQPAITIRIVVGEKPMTKDNRLLAKFDLTGIPPAPRGIPQIQVTFELDVNDDLTVKAKDLGTGSEEGITIQSNNFRLSEEEIERYIVKSEQFAKQDIAFYEQVAARNDLESYVYSLYIYIRDKFTSKFTDENDNILEKAVIVHSLKAQIQDAQFAKLSSEDKEILKKAVEGKLAWLERNQEAKISELKVQKKELEDLIQPILSKPYQNAGGKQDQHQHEDL